MVSLDEVVIKISADIDGAMAGIRKVDTAVAKMDKSVGKSASRIRGASKAMATSIGFIGVAAGAAAVGLGVGMAAQAASMETYMTTLAQLEGSQEAAAEKLRWLRDFAKSTPFELPGLIEATTKLKAYGIDAEDVLETLGDTASAMGKPINMAVEALADAQTGEFERMKEFGMKAVVVSKANAEELGATAEQVGMTALTYTDKFGKQQADIIDRNNRAQITSTIQAIWNEKYAGGMEKQSATVKGMISNIKGSMSAGVLAIMGFNDATGTFDAGSLFDKTKMAVSGLLDRMNDIDFATIGKKIETTVNRIIEIAKQLASDLEPTFEGLKSIAESLVGIFKDVVNSFETNGDEAKTFADALNTVVTALSKVFIWIDKHPMITKLAVTVGVALLAFAYILPVITAVVGALTTVGAAVASAAAFFAGGGTIMTGLGIAIAAIGGPITLVVAAVALLAAAWATNLFGIRDKTASAIETIKYWITSFKDAIFNNMETIKTILTLAMGPIGWIIVAFKNWDKIKEIVTTIVGFVKDAMGGMVEKAKTWGKNIIQGLIDGIKSMFGGITNAVDSAADIVKDYLGFGSPTKKGPGRDVMKWGPNMVDGFVKGVEGSMGLLNGTFGALSGPVPIGKTGITAANQTTSTVPNNIRIEIRDTIVREDSDIDKLILAIDKKMADKARGVSL